MTWQPTWQASALSPTRWWLPSGQAPTSGGNDERDHWFRDGRPVEGPGPDRNDLRGRDDLHRPDHRVDASAGAAPGSPPWSVSTTRRTGRARSPSAWPPTARPWSRRRPSADTSQRRRSTSTSPARRSWTSSSATQATATATTTPTGQCRPSPARDGAAGRSAPTDCPALDRAGPLPGQRRSRIMDVSLAFKDSSKNNTNSTSMTGGRRAGPGQALTRRFFRSTLSGRRGSSDTGVGRAAGRAVMGSSGTGTLDEAYQRLHAT